MVLQKFIQIGTKLAKYDAKAWDKLYFGIRKDIKLGIRTGGAIGGAIGSLLDDETTFLDDGISSPNEYVSKARSQYQARGRQTKRCYSKYTGKPIPCFKQRRSYFSKSR